MGVIVIRARRGLSNEEFKNFLNIVRKIAEYNVEDKSWILVPEKLSTNVLTKEEALKIFDELKKYSIISNLENLDEFLDTVFGQQVADFCELNLEDLSFTLPRRIGRDAFRKLCKYCVYERGVFRLRSIGYLGEVTSILSSEGITLRYDVGELTKAIQKMKHCIISREKGLLKISFRMMDDHILNKLKEACTIKYFIEKPIFDEQGNFQETQLIERKFTYMKINYKEKTVHTSMGLIDKVLHVLSEEGFKVENKVEELSDININIKPSFTLLPHQKYAYEKWFKNKRGTIAIFTRGGKSFIAMQAIANLKKPTIILVTTRELAATWKNYLQKYLGIKAGYIGYLGEGIKNVKPITVAIYNSAVKYIEHIQEEFELAIFDECLTPDTLIVLSDGGVKTIKEIVDELKKGNFVGLYCGGSASNPIEKEVSEIYEITTDFGILRASSKHIHMVIKRSKKAFSGSRKPNKVPVEPYYSFQLEKGDFLLVPETIPHTTKYNWTPEQLSLLSLIVFKGYLDSKNNLIKVRLDKDEKCFSEVFIKGVKAFNAKVDIVSVNENNEGLIIYIQDAALINALKKFLGGSLSAKNKLMYISEQIFYSPLESVKEFIKMMFSVKGRLSIGKDKQDIKLSLDLGSLEFIRKIQLLLLKFGIFSTVSKKTDSDEFSLEVSEYDLLKFSEVIGLFHPEKNKQLKRVSKQLRERFLGKPITVTLNGIRYRLAEIKEIKVLKEKAKVYDFTTQTHVFVANGMLTHNCHHVPANTFKEVALRLGALYRMALSATPKRRDRNEALLYALCGELLVDIDYTSLLNLKIVAPIEVFRTFFVEGQDEKLKTLMNILEKHKDGKVLIFTQYLNTAGKVYEELLRKGYRVALITGSTEDNKRRFFFQAFVKGVIKIIVTTTVLDEGITVPDADVAVIYEGSGEPRQMIQRIGRVLGYVPGKTAKIYELVDIKSPREKRAYFRRKWVRELYLTPELKDHLEGKSKSSVTFQMKLEDFK